MQFYLLDFRFIRTIGQLSVADSLIEFKLAVLFSADPSLTSTERYEYRPTTFPN
jgi:hypothetical protein